MKYLILAAALLAGCSDTDAVLTSAKLSEINKAASLASGICDDPTIYSRRTCIQNGGKMCIVEGIHYVISCDVPGTSAPVKFEATYVKKD